MGIGATIETITDFCLQVLLLASRKYASQNYGHNEMYWLIVVAALDLGHVSHIGSWTGVYILTSSDRYPLDVIKTRV